MKLFKGQSLVELLVAIGVAAIFFPALATGLVASREGQAQQEQRLEATALVKESLEAVRQVRERGWSVFAINGTFHPAPFGNTWQLSTGEEIINDFTRRVEISDVRRNSNGIIVESGGSLDLSTKKVTHTVSWTSPSPNSVSIVTYLSRYLENITYTETTVSDFEAGVQNGVTVTNTNGGEVILGAGGGGDWCSPDAISASLNLPKSGVANALTAVQGYVFSGTGDNASGESFIKTQVTNTNPPVASNVGAIDGYKTNDVFGEPNYGYIATDTNDKEIVIVDISSSPFTAVGYFDGSGSSDGSSIYVKDNVGYLVQGSVLRNFDLTSKTGSRPAIDPDGVSLAGQGTSVVVVGSYAYVTINSTATQLQIFDLTNPNNITYSGSVSISGTLGADVFVNESGTRAYLVTKSSSNKEFFIIDITSKTGSRPVIGSYEANGMSPNAVTVVPGNRAILVGIGGEEYQVVNLASETSLVRCGGLQVDVGINDVDSVLESDGDAYSYVLTREAESELKIIEGGPGGQFSTSGVFESVTFDAGLQTAFNRMSFTIDEPPQTDIRFQIAVADPVDNSCTNAVFNFVGPDATADTFYETAGAIPFHDDNITYENPARCLRYKAYLITTDISSTPVLQDITFNYSP